MLKRIATSLIGIILFFAVVLAHHYALYIAVTLVTLGMLYEMNKMMDAEKELSILSYAVGLILCFGCASSTRFFTVIASAMLYGLAIIFLHGKISSKNILASAFITIFISLFMGMLISIRKIDKFIVILPFACAWLSDTGAYFIGSLLGKHKLCEKISPKKTVEGAIAGLIFSIIGSVLFISVMTNFAPNQMAIIKFAFIGLAAGAISQIGDLIFSCIKRDCGKKDFGSILPGHGGILDRFDSVLFVLPFIYYTIFYIIK